MDHSKKCCCIIISFTFLGVSFSINLGNDAKNAFEMNGKKQMLER